MTFPKNTTTYLSSRDEPNSAADEWHAVDEQEKKHLMGYEEPDQMLEQSELVPISLLAQMREFDRRPGTPDAISSPERYEALKQHIAQHGITSPVWIDWHPGDNEAHISEGNHRLAVAQDLGMTHLPAVVYTHPWMKSRGNSIMAPKPYPADQHGYIPSYLKPSDLGFESKPWGKNEPFKTAATNWQPENPTWRFKRADRPHSMGRMAEFNLGEHNHYRFDNDEHFHEGHLKNERDVSRYLDYENPMDFLRAHLDQLAKEHGVKRWKIDGRHANGVNGNEMSSGWAQTGKDATGGMPAHSILSGPITNRASYLMGLHELAHLVGGREEMHDKMGVPVVNPEGYDQYRTLDYGQQYKPELHEYDRQWGGYPTAKPDDPTWTHPEKWVHAPMESLDTGYDPNEPDSIFGDMDDDHMTTTSPYTFSENKLETEARAWEWALQHSKIHTSAPVLHQVMNAMMTYADPKDITHFSPTAKRIFNENYGFGGEEGRYPLDEKEYGPGAEGATDPWQEYKVDRVMTPEQASHIESIPNSGFMPMNEMDRNNWMRQQGEVRQKEIQRKMQNEALIRGLEIPLRQNAPEGYTVVQHPYTEQTYHFPTNHPVVKFVNDPTVRNMTNANETDFSKFVPKAAKVAMAERTGDPQVDALIEQFLQQRPGDWTHSDEGETMEQYRNPEAAHGNCQVISQQFADFAKQHGFKAYVTDTDTEEMGYKPTGPGGEIGFNENDEMQYGHYPEHTIVTIVVDDPSHPYGKEFYIDFSASQYGYTDHPKVTSKTSAADTAGAMVAIYPPPEIAQKIAVENGEAPEQLHITLAYFQDAAADREGESWDDVGEIVAQVAAHQSPIEVTIGGVARFDTPNEDKPVVGTVDAPGLVELHLALKEALSAAGFNLNGEHGFLPHLTFAYVGEGDDNPEIDTDASWTANEIVLVVGGDKTTYKLGAGSAATMLPKAARKRSKAIAAVLDGITRPDALYPLYRRTSSFEDAVSRVQSVLTPDLLHKEYRDNPQAHCYAASEALYHMLGGKGAGLTPMHIPHEGSSHWFLSGPNGEVIDATHGQFEEPVPYENARGKGFLTAAPSKRAQEIMRRVGQQKTAWYDSDNNWTTRVPFVIIHPHNGTTEEEGKVHIGMPGQDHEQLERELQEAGYSRKEHGLTHSFLQGQVNFGNVGGWKFGPEMHVSHDIPEQYHGMLDRIEQEAADRMTRHDVRTSNDEFEKKHPREQAGRFTAKSDQHEVPLHDHKGKLHGHWKRCKHCGVRYFKDADQRGRTECPTCGLDPERVLRQTAKNPYGNNPDAVAQSLGWGTVKINNMGHAMYGWSDPHGQQHIVTGYGKHGDPNQQAMHVRQNMTKCMNGACGHYPQRMPQAPGPGEMIEEGGAPVLHAGQEVIFGGGQHWIQNIDGELAHIYDASYNQQTVPVSQLRAANFWHESDDDLAERVRDFNKGDHPDTDPDYAFVWYQGKIEMEPWHHNVSFPTMADNLLKNLGLDVLNYDGKFENDTTSDWVAGCAWNGREVKFDIPQLADEDKVDQAKAAVKKVLRGSEDVTTASRWVAVT